MSDRVELLRSVPSWVLRTLPTNAVVDDDLERRVHDLAKDLAGNLTLIDRALYQVRNGAEYDSAANLACTHIWRAIDQLFDSPSPDDRKNLGNFAENHMTLQAKSRVLRRLSKDSDTKVRSGIQKMVSRIAIREVSLPVGKKGDWNPSGWFRGIKTGQLQPRRAATKIQEKLGLPPLSTVGELRKLIGINSAKQLGYFLMATDAEGGPYTKFSIPKRDGTQREICAPKKQLRWVQQQILRKILDKIPVSDAAHGFVPGRSTVSNAAAHQGAVMILKFDLKDFFPTIHQNRVLGMFASFGYDAAEGRFGTDDKSNRVAPTLARLCTYAADHKAFGAGFTPQGAPTSPAISNIVCRGLDARLAGLAKRNNAAYTRYADDLTFSFKEDDVNFGRFRWWVDQICHQEGFIVNQQKFRAIRSSQRQTVTGIVVNDTLRIPRWQRRRFRAILHNCSKHGVDSQARDNPSFRSYLRGFASYIHMVHPSEGKELMAQVNELLGEE